METHTPPTADSGPIFRDFTTDHPIMIGDQVHLPKGTKITVRKPGSPELRGMTLMALSQLDVGALHELMPRITTPVILKNCSLDPADLMQFGGEVMDFLLPTAAKQAASQTG